MSRKTLVATLFVAGSVAMFGTACGNDDPSPEENAAAACDSYAEFVGAVAEARTSLSESSSIGEIRDARDNVSTAYDNLVVSAEQVNEDRLAALEESWNSYDEGVENLDPNLTVPEAAQQLRGNIESVVSAQNELGASLGC